MQEAYLRAFQFFGSFHGADGRAWLLRIVRNTCYTWLQRNRGHKLAAFNEEIQKLKTQDVTDDELRMFKTRTEADLIRGLASNEGLAEQLAIYQTRYGDWHELFRYLERVDKVTKADIRRAHSALK